jgi:hypothetical protein
LAGPPAIREKIVRSAARTFFSRLRHRAAKAGQVNMTFLKCFSALTTLAALTLSLPAWADIPSDDQCFAASVGEPCDNTSGMQPGVCREAMCTRATPDGSMTYACYRCLAEDGGMGGQPNEVGGTGAVGGETNGSGSSAGGTPSGGSGPSTAGTKSGSSGASTGSKSDSDAGCSLSHAPGGAGALAAALVTLGCAIAGLRRRRWLTS